MSDRTAAIASAFGSARDYDRHAHVQRRAAEALAERIAALELESPRLLEFGCGTGFLTDALIRRGVGGQWRVTDLAPDMVERCRSRMAGRGDLTFSVLDVARGEPDGHGAFDVVTASLAAQWLGDLDGAVGRMLRWVRPGGHVLFNTLASGTFREWREALAEAGCAAGTPDYPDVAELAAIRRDAQAAEPTTDNLIDRHANALGFLKSLKAIGAHVPAPGHRPASPVGMRAAMRAFEASGSAASYEVVTLHFRRPWETAA
ncbi:MAG: biotin biosynthesis protein [Croceicoccus sp.]|nr:biotin biosynthesis protein [Croceicoccus sp.]|tara:strand:+ start:114 stop:893 length:780 start_codon:yes stop_codon:yes gene_type:complete